RTPRALRAARFACDQAPGRYPAVCGGPHVCCPVNLRTPRALRAARFACDQAPGRYPAVCGGPHVCCPVSLHRRRRTGWKASRAGVATAIAVLSGIVVAAIVPWPGLHWRDDSPITASASRILEYDQGSGRLRMTQLRIALMV